MKVICIESDNSLPIKNQLIVGKEYSVHHKRYDDTCTVISDFYIKGEYGFHRYYKISMFVTLEEYREKKLNELGI
jgi:hypothetical protein